MPVFILIEDRINKNINQYKAKETERSDEERTVSFHSNLTAIL